MQQPHEPEPDTPEPAPVPPIEPDHPPIDEPRREPPQTALSLTSRRRVGMIVH